MDQVIGIFPTPLMLAKGAIPPDLVAALVRQFDETDKGPNVRTTLLSHTPMTNPRAHENYMAVLRHTLPRLSDYGEALMGEKLDWGVKEIWINRMEPGGAQKMHNHANSFISGIIYLTETHPASATVFHRNSGTNTFQMVNENKRCRISAYNSPIFRLPEVGPGDMVLFPSYMLHEVPPNQGEPRMTAAFNALPDRLDSWGYVVKFR
ncbi:MAG: putative 2OG-Fe(II) oxygenase [Pseudomonadota bacterium]